MAPASPSARRPRGTIVATAVVLVLLVAGCNGKAPAARSPSTTASPATSAPTSAPLTVSPAVGCPPGAAYCDTFGDRSSGWGSTNTADYYYGYDAFGGGTFRVGSRADSTTDALGPIQLRDISPDYSVQIDTDVALNSQTPIGSGFGLTCWVHDAGNGNESAFVFFVYPDHAKIVLWDQGDGSPVDLASANVSLLRAGTNFNHVTASCIQGTGPDGRVQAQLSLSINGTQAVTAEYGKSAQTAAWSVSATDGKSRAGVLAVGRGADVFYDNFALTSECQPGGDVACPSTSNAATTTAAGATGTATGTG